MTDLETRVAEVLALVEKGKHPGTYGYPSDTFPTKAAALFHDHGDALLAAARDGDRLDWLMDEAATVKTDGSGGWYVHRDWLPGERGYGPRADSRRAAIDAAIQQEAGR